MLRPRIIPVLLLRGRSLVKTVKFKKFSYIGDPCNTVRIFNELEVDEISILDIEATIKKKDPNYNLIGDIASEAFMPLTYGGGIDSIEKAKKKSRILHLECSFLSLTDKHCIICHVTVRVFSFDRKPKTSYAFHVLSILHLF